MVSVTFPFAMPTLLVLCGDMNAVCGRYSVAKTCPALPNTNGLTNIYPAPLAAAFLKSCACAALTFDRLKDISNTPGLPGSKLKVTCVDAGIFGGFPWLKFGDTEQIPGAV